MVVLAAALRLFAFPLSIKSDVKGVASYQPRPYANVHFSPRIPHPSANTSRTAGTCCRQFSGTSSLIIRQKRRGPASCTI